MTEIVTLDGIEYEITVLSVPGGYAASWHCLTCKVAGPLGQATHSADDAARRGEALAYTDHHVAIHRAAIR